jgi:hypothetical protein
MEVSESRESMMLGACIRFMMKKMNVTTLEITDEEMLKTLPSDDEEDDCARNDCVMMIEHDHDEHLLRIKLMSHDEAESYMKKKNDQMSMEEAVMRMMKHTYTLGGTDGSVQPIERMIREGGSMFWKKGN